MPQSEDPAFIYEIKKLNSEEGRASLKKLFDSFRGLTPEGLEYKSYAEEVAKEDSELETQDIIGLEYDRDSMKPHQMLISHWVKKEIFSPATTLSACFKDIEGQVKAIQNILDHANTSENQTIISRYGGLANIKQQILMIFVFRNYMNSLLSKGILNANMSLQDVLTTFGARAVNLNEQVSRLKQLKRRENKRKKKTG